jgi:hypothetical protein
MKLEKLDDSSLELYNFYSSAAYWETDMAYFLFVRFVYLTHAVIQ